MWGGSGTVLQYVTHRRNGLQTDGHRRHPDILLNETEGFWGGQTVPLVRCGECSPTGIATPPATSPPSFIIIMSYQMFTIFPLLLVFLCLYSMLFSTFAHHGWGHGIQTVYCMYVAPGPRVTRVPQSGRVRGQGSVFQRTGCAGMRLVYCTPSSARISNRSDLIYWLF